MIGNKRRQDNSSVDTLVESLASLSVTKPYLPPEKLTVLHDSMITYVFTIIDTMIEFWRQIK